MEVTLIELQWQHTKSNGGLELSVNETGKWTHYKKAKHYKVDTGVTTNSGFATFQNYIKLSKQGLFNLDILSTKND